jgi:hypothetical protein
MSRKAKIVEINLYKDTQAYDVTLLIRQDTTPSGSPEALPISEFMDTEYLPPYLIAVIRFILEKETKTATEV